MIAKSNPGAATRILHLNVLALLALAQPLFDILSHNPAYFVVSRSQRVDVIFLILFFSILLPGLLALLTEGLRRLNESAGNWAFLISFHVLLLLLVTLAVNRIFSWNNLMCLVAAPLITAGIGAGYYRFASVRSFFTLLLPALILVPGVFLASRPLRAFLWSEHDPGPLKKIESTTPVVLIVFDEFPMSSLLDETHSIDAELFPNFARLAKQSTWFRNATTAGDYTIDAVPSILTGEYPKPGSMPAFYDHRDNLFTLLGGSYTIRAFEEVTSLCPEKICGRRDERSFRQRTTTLFKDLYGIYLHLILPQSMKTGLPPISEKWIDLWVVDSGRTRSYERFLHSIQAQEQPAVYYCHLELPHRPFVYAPDGAFQPAFLKETFEKIDRELPNDRFFMSQLYGHLVQVRFVDKLLGDLLERLEQTGLYERSILVVTADHGICFQKGLPLRSVTSANYQDILLIPFFIKAPGQTEGRIDDRNVETIDILPTITDALSLERSWPDGVSLLNRAASERNAKRVLVQDKKKLETYPSQIRVNDETLKAQLRLRKYLK